MDASDTVRIGASGLLGDIKRQVNATVTSRYAAAYRNPMA